MSEDKRSNYRITGGFFATVTLVGSSGVAAALPLVLIAVSARDLGIRPSMYVSLGLVFAGYLTAVVAATEIESRLPVLTPLALPRWVWLPMIGPISAVALAPVDPATGAIVMVIGVVPLECSRMVAAAFGRIRMELMVASVMVAGFGMSWVARDSTVTVASLGSAMAIATALRLFDQRHFFAAPRRRGWHWLLADTVVTGSSQPAISAIVAAAMTASETVSFRTTISVAAVLSPVLAVVRVRLLGGARSKEAATGLLLCGALACIVLAMEFTGTLDRVLGPAWEDASPLALALALLWRIAILLTTVPFAALRTSGKFAVVMRVRFVSTGAYFVCGAVAIALHGQIWTTFAAFVIAELFGTAIYSHVAKRELGDRRDGIQLKVGV